MLAFSGENTTTGVITITKTINKNEVQNVKIDTVLLLGLGLTGLQAQTSANATGGDASGGGGSASYSIGQVVYTTNTGHKMVLWHKGCNSRMKFW